MKDQILKIAKVKSEKEFYKKYPTEEAFMKAHGKELKKAAMGTAMVKQQLEQLTDFGNPPIAQYGTSFKPLSYEDALTNSRAMNTGRTKDQYIADRALGKVEDEPAPKEPDGIGNLVSMGMDIAGQFMGDGEDGEGGIPPEIQDAIDAGFEMKNGGYVTIPKADFGAIAGALKGIGAKSGGIGNLLGDTIGGKGTSQGIMKAGKNVFSGGLKSGIKNLGTKAGLSAAGKAAGLGVLNAAPEILGGIGQMQEQKKNIANADQAAKVSGLVNQATRSNPVEVQKNNFARPEDALVQPGQLAAPQGTGSNFLQMQSGGEIQNTYAPGTLYDDLGYEPLNDSEIEQYQNGGKKLLSRDKINIDSYGNTGVGYREIYQNPNMSRDTSYSYDSPKAMLRYETNGGKPFAYVGGRGGFTSSQPDSLSKYKQLLSDPFDKDVEKSYNATRKLASGKYKNGGDIPEAGFGDYFQSSGQASIGKGVGSAIGSVFGGPLGGMVGGALGTLAGNLFGGKRDAERLAALQKQTQKNTMETASAQMLSGIRGSFGNVMEEGGWVSNDWQPQVITKFGDYDVKDLLKPDPTMDTLRSGGHLAQTGYTAPSAEGLQTYAMGGNLKTHWGGGAELMSYNPYIPGGGETVMFRGQSHDDTNSKGQSGIGITYGDNPVEVERGEPMTEMNDGGVVYGNMVIDKFAADEIGDIKAKGKKYKNYVADLSKTEAKQNKILQKASALALDQNINDKFDQLTLNASQANIIGANMKLKEIADKKLNAAAVQNAILETAEERGLVSDELAKGNIKEAKFGGKFTAQDGKSLKSFLKTPLAERKKLAKDLGYTDYSGKDIKQQEKLYNLFKNKNATKRKNNLSTDPILTYTDQSSEGFYDPITHEYVTDMGYPSKLEKDLNTRMLNKKISPSDVSKVETIAKSMVQPEKRGKRDWEGVATALMQGVMPLLRPTDQEPLDPSQLYPEMMALASNQLEPVQAQQFTPLLQGAPSDISLQDQLNEITAQARSAERMSQYNPEAAANLFAQVSQAKNKVLADQFRMNQARKEQVYAENRQALNQAQLQNLQILDNQYVRQAQAKSATKAQALEAMKSIADKTAKNKLENRQLGIYENLYNYRFDPMGRAFSFNDPYQFNIPDVGNIDLNNLSEDDKKKLKSHIEKTVSRDKAGNITGSKEKTSTTTSRNGSIVKAIKNL